MLVLESLNSGSQTSEIIYSEEQINLVINEKNEIKSKFDKLRQEFTVRFRL